MGVYTGCQKTGNIMRLRWSGASTGTVSERGAAAFSPSPLLWRGLGALVLGVMLARWSWLLLAPHATTVAVVPEHGATVEAGRLFGAAVFGAPTPGGAALPNVRLVGVFAAETGKPGFAVLKLDDKQQVGVVVGESVVPETRLLEVHPDYVLLERAGVQQRVDIEGKVAGAAGVGVVPAVR